MSPLIISVKQNSGSLRCWKQKKTFCKSALMTSDTRKKAEIVISPNFYLIYLFILIKSDWKVSYQHDLPKSTAYWTSRKLESEKTLRSVTKYAAVTRRSLQDCGIVSKKRDMLHVGQSKIVHVIQQQQMTGMLTADRNKNTQCKGNIFGNRMKNVKPNSTKLTLKGLYVRKPIVRIPLTSIHHEIQRNWAADHRYWTWLQ